MNTFKLIKNHTGKLLPLGLSILNPNNFRVLVKNFNALYSGPKWEDYINKHNLKYNDLIQRSITWIKNSQDIVGSGGVGCYEFYRWTKGYPEVAGYIIPTFWDSYHYYKIDDLKDRAIKMTDWELGIQHDDGGWEGEYEGDNRPWSA